MVTGGAGVMTAIPFDQSSTLVTDSGEITHSTSTSPEIMTITKSGDYTISWATGVGDDLLLTGASAELILTRNAVQTTISGDKQSHVTGNDIILHGTTPIDLEPNDTLTLYVASFGLGGASLIVGDGNTFMRIQGTPHQ